VPRDRQILTRRAADIDQRPTVAPTELLSLPDQLEEVAVDLGVGEVVAQDAAAVGDDLREPDRLEPLRLEALCHAADPGAGLRDPELPEVIERDDAHDSAPCLGSSSSSQNRRWHTGQRLSGSPRASRAASLSAVRDTV
jgi:hypothetical protein